MDAISTAADYLAADVTTLERRWAARSDGEWQAAGAAAAVRLFREAAARVPAYARFLRDHGVDAADVHTPAHLLMVPPTTKSCYLDAYPLRDRMWDGDPAGAAIVHASSGTTGGNAAGNAGTTGAPGSTTGNAAGGTTGGTSGSTANRNQAQSEAFAAEMERCNAMTGSQRTSCANAAKKRHGQM